MAVALSMVLLRDEAALPAARIAEEMRARYPDLDAAAPTDEGNTASLKLRNGELIVALMPAPVPWADLEGPCATSLLWKNAADDIKPHRAHFIVSILSELNEIEQSVLLTQATAAVLAGCDAAIGVYWGNATLLVPKPIFSEFAEKVLPLGPPLDIWIDFRVGWEAQQRSAGFTQGMKALGHMDLMAQDSPEKPSDLRERLHGLARYLLDNGPVIKDGDTIGERANEKIRIVYGPSTFGHAGLVMQLRYESAPAKPWWKVW